MKSKLKRAKDFIAKLRSVNSKISKMEEALARIEKRQLETSNGNNLQQYEFRCFSQWGEDGIIQYLINNVNISEKYFVEFGVESYQESNTRFLLINDNWSGLIIDGSESNINFVKQSELYWRHNLTPICAFITPDNINSLLKPAPEKIGLLSVDVDGQDLWILDEINNVTADILILEYNHRFGPYESVSVPKNNGFERFAAHYSGIYFGASLTALSKVANKKGYALVGCNSAGNNAFYVRRELLNEKVKEVSVEEAFVQGKFRESRDENGELNFLSHESEKDLLSTLELTTI